MKIVIAGGTGFLGAPLAEMYAEEGHDVRVLTRSLMAGDTRHDPGTGMPGVTKVGWKPDGNSGPWAGTLDGAARAVMELGPRAVVAKQGEYGAALFTEEGFFSLPAYPLETVIDPTGAGDSFAGGFFGYLDSQGGATDDATLRRAMTYGSAVASFWVEEFGCERAESLTREEIEERYEGFRAMTAVEGVTAG